MGDNSNYIIVDGKTRSADDPVVPALSGGLMYGDGVFETFRTYSGQTFFLQQHLDRLHSGCRILGISAAKHFDQIEEHIARLLRKNNLFDADAIVRMQVWRDGQRGYQPEPDAQSHISITTSACPQAFSSPKLSTVTTRRISSDSLPSDAKFTNSINYILAAREASQKGGDDALMQTVEGWVSETTIANIFWIENDIVFTPSNHCDLIPGITRDILLRLIGELDWEVQQGKFHLDHILNADAVWICNSVREVLPVHQINQQTFDTNHELLQNLQEHFVNFRDKNLKALDY